MWKDFVLIALVLAGLLFVALFGCNYSSHIFHYFRGENLRFTNHGVCNNHYCAHVVMKPKVILSYVLGSTNFQQVFNPSYVAPLGKRDKPGLLVRSQNCSAEIGGKCVFCSGDGPKASVIGFTLLNDDGSVEPLNEDKIVFGPSSKEDAYGTEDPRIQFDPVTKKFYLFFTAWSGGDPILSFASTEDPAKKGGWIRHGPVFPSHRGPSKSAALIPPLKDGDKYHLLWGDSQIRVAKSENILNWTNPQDASFFGDILIQPRKNKFDSTLVESGPPPMRLEDGNFLFLYNSAKDIGNKHLVYNVGFLILDGNDPSKVLARSEEPLFRPEEDWATGSAPYTCNVWDVVFLEAAQPLGRNSFRVWMGGADAVVVVADIEISSK